jgi:hypothetical protein
MHKEGRIWEELKRGPLGRQMCGEICLLVTHIKVEMLKEEED